MKYAKVFFVGLGGAGQRHLRIFKQLLPEHTEFSAFRATGKTPLLNSDFTVNTGSSLKHFYGLRMFGSLEEGLAHGPDLVVIANPTSLHYETALLAAQHNAHLFVEKPFSHSLEGFETFENTVRDKQLVFFISYQRRFHPWIRKAKDLLSKQVIGKVIHAVFNVASYVPSWHPYEDFHELYACRKDLGGGVLLTEIHELDLCYWFFGRPQSIYAQGGNYSSTPMEVEDTVHLTLHYDGFVVSIHLSFMQKRNRRDFCIAGSEGYLDWTAEGNRLTVESYRDGNKTKVLSDPHLANDDLFVAQASYFLKEFKPSDIMYLDSARATLEMVEAARQSMRERREIPLPPPDRCRS